MSLVVEDGSGLTNSNAYVDIAFCNNYFTNRNEADWISASDELKTSSIIKATDYLDSHYIFKSDKKSQSQSLMFPRTDWPDVIPIEIKKANAIYSLFAVRNQLYDSEKLEITGSVSREKKKEKVDVIETETDVTFIGAGSIREVKENRFDSIKFLIHQFIIEKQTIVPSNVKPGEETKTYATIPGDDLNVSRV